jgi:hypothetical protein
MQRSPIETATAARGWVTRHPATGGPYYKLLLL